MEWLNGNRGSMVVVMLWIVGWSLGFGGLIELLVDPHGEILDIWPAVMAVPGLIGGVVFAALFRVADRRRVMDVSLARFTACGVP